MMPADILDVFIVPHAFLDQKLAEKIVQTLVHLFEVVVLTP